jgi:hypothetical protein
VARVRDKDALASSYAIADQFTANAIKVSSK